MKKLFVIYFIMLAPFAISAQETERKEIALNIGFDIGLPTGSLKNSHSLGYGGSLQGEYKISKITDVTLYAGYTSFNGKTTSIITGGQTISFKQSVYSVIPVLAGCKFHLSKLIYTHPQFGVSFFKGGGSSATFSAGIGAKVEEHFDLSVRYQSTLETNFKKSFLGLKIGYVF